MIKTIELNYSEMLYEEIKQYANEKGISIENAFLELVGSALRSDKLTNGVVTAVAPQVQGQLRETVLEALSQFDSTKQVVIEQVKESENKEALNAQAIDQNGIVFITNPEVKELIAEINKTRALKGLAPIEKSLSELLYHWGENLGDYSSFNETTGLDYSWFKSAIIAQALAERETNGAETNLIETVGIFSKHRIVDTPAIAS